MLSPFARLGLPAPRVQQDGQWPGFQSSWLPGPACLQLPPGSLLILACFHFAPTSEPFLLSQVHGHVHLHRWVGRNPVAAAAQPSHARQLCALTAIHPAPLLARGGSELWLCCSLAASPAPPAHTPAAMLSSPCTAVNLKSVFRHLDATVRRCPCLWGGLGKAGRVGLVCGQGRQATPRAQGQMLAGRLPRGQPPAPSRRRPHAPSAIPAPIHAAA
jgi:hypothetical protein